MVMSITLLVVFMLLMFLGVPIAISLGAGICVYNCDNVFSASFHGGTVHVYIYEQLYYGCGPAVYSVRFPYG